MSQNSSSDSYDGDDETSSGESDNAEELFAELNVDVPLPAPLPWYVRTTQSVRRRRHRIRIGSAAGVARFVVTDSTTQPTIAYSIVFDAEYPRVAAPRTLLSLSVHSQMATSLPFDCMIRVCGAPRPYVIRRRVVLPSYSLDEELVTDGHIFIDEARGIAFCSLDARGFVADEVPHRRCGAGVLVPRNYEYAALLCDVVLAHQLEAMDALSRRCVNRNALTQAPLEGSDALLFPSTSAFDAAVAYIERELVPHANRTIDASRSRFSVAPLEHATWTEALTNQLVPVGATIGFRLYFVV
jgi:hypothetical protein